MNNETCMFIFFENLRRLRQRAGLSCEEMAKRLKIETKTLQTLESGILLKNVDCMILSYLWKEFGVSPSAMFGELISLNP